MPLDLNPNQEYTSQSPREKLKLMMGEINKEIAESDDKAKETELSELKTKIENALKKEDSELQTEFLSIEKEFEKFKSDLNELKNIVKKTHLQKQQNNQPNYKEIADLGKEEARNRMDLDGMQEFYETIPWIGKLVSWLTNKATKDGNSKK